MLLIHILDKVHAHVASYYMYMCYIILIVYNNNHYFDIVAEIAEQSMVDAVEEISQLPHYAENGEVVNNNIINTSLYFSGSSQMPDMILLPMPFIQLFLAFQESEWYQCFQQY